MLGKARLISCEDFENAQANSAMKEAAKKAQKVDTAGKRRHVRKCTGIEEYKTLEVEAEDA